jgi:predicted metalloprotease
VGLQQDTPGAHGINDDRITAFMRGYLGGIVACALLEQG